MNIFKKLFKKRNAETKVSAKEFGIQRGLKDTDLDNYLYAVTLMLVGVDVTKSKNPPSKEVLGVVCDYVCMTFLKTLSN